MPLDQCDEGFGNKIIWHLRVTQTAECITSSKKTKNTIATAFPFV